MCQELMKQDAYGMKSVSIKADLTVVFVIKKQCPNDDKCRCECKELIYRGVFDKGFIWNPSNCECECYKSCDFSEYLDYKNCKWKKRLVNKLVACSSPEQCTENIEKTRLVEIASAKNENKHKFSSCTLYIVLFSIFFTINIGIGSYFLCFHSYIKKMLFVLNLVHALKKHFNKLINGKNQTNRDQKSNLLFLQ